jgi:hypothetical protein
MLSMATGSLRTHSFSLIPGTLSPTQHVSSTVTNSPRWFTHDPAVYPDPMSFRPECYITTPTHTAEPDLCTWIFGYSRRACPGRYVADNALFITIAQTLSVFNVTKPVENGVVIEPELKFERGAISHLVTYRASIEPRSEKHAEVIKQAELEYPWEKSDVEALKTVNW